MSYKKPITKIMFVFVILILIWTFMFLVDYIRVNSGSSPVFVIREDVYKDGGSAIVKGLGYKIFIYRSIFGKTIGYEMIPFWKSFNMEKYDRTKKEYEEEYPIRFENFDETYYTDINNNIQNVNIYTWEDIIN